MPSAPRRSLSRLLDEPAKLRLGLLAILFVAAGYTVALALIAASPGRISQIPAWIAIPLDRYFFWETFFIGTVTFGCWILCGGTVYLLAKAFGGHGSFDDTLAALAFAIAIPTTFAFVHDAFTGFLTATGIMSAAAWEASIVTPGLGRTLFWTYMLAYAAGLLVYVPVATGVAQRLRTLPAVVVGLAGVVVYQGVYFIFIR